MTYRIGVDGGGTKTECILLDAEGGIVARQLAPGCSPSVVGPEQARRILTDALQALTAAVTGSAPSGGSAVAGTHLYMAGSRAFWEETALTLPEFGPFTVADDSRPVLELATQGKPGLVLHAGTGSFVAARGPDGAIHYAGGTGWRFGDPGSGYDLGRRAVSRALLELQGWLPLTQIGSAVRAQTQLGEAADAAAVTRFFYQHAEPNRQIAALAPAVLQLAGEGDVVAVQLVNDSMADLLVLACGVAAKLFADTPLASLPTGVSGPILNHPVVLEALVSKSPLTLVPVAGTPIDGVRRLVMRG